MWIYVILFLISSILIGLFYGVNGYLVIKKTIPREYVSRQNKRNIMNAVSSGGAFFVMSVTAMHLWYVQFFKLGFLESFTKFGNLVLFGIAGFALAFSMLLWSDDQLLPAAIISDAVIVIIMFIILAYCFNTACKEKLQTLPFEKSVSIEYIEKYSPELADTLDMHGTGRAMKNGGSKFFGDTPEQLLLAVDSTGNNIVYAVKGSGNKLFVKYVNYGSDMLKIVYDDNAEPNIEIVTQSRQFVYENRILKSEQKRFITVTAPAALCYGDVDIYAVTKTTETKEN